MSIRQAILLTNKVFNKQFGRANVIALWPEIELRKFTAQELEDLASHANIEKTIGDEQFKIMVRRLLQRIEHARRDKEES